MMKLYIGINQLNKEITPNHVLLVVILLGIIYRGGWSDTTLFICTLLIRGFYYFNSRYFVYIAGVYLILICVYSIQGIIEARDTSVIFFFWYVFMAYIVSLLEDNTIEDEKIIKKND